MAEHRSPTPSMPVREAKADDRRAWDAFIAQRPEADVLQSWTWADAGIATGERWVRLVASDDEGAVRGLVQCHLRSTTFGRTVLYAPHGPIWEREAREGQAVLRSLLDGMRDLGRAERGILLKVDPRGDPTGRDDAHEVRRALLSAGLGPARHELQAPSTRIIDLLDGGEELMRTWVPDARTRVRRAAKEGITTHIDRQGASGDLDEFGALLAETSERAGFRIRSREFMVALADGFRRTDDWFLALARFEGRAVAGICGPRTGDRAFYLYAASTRDPAMERKRVGYAAMAALMRALAEAGTRTLDLWGVREPGDESVDATWEGFSSFKTRFGGRPLRHPGTFDLVIDPFWHRIRELRERFTERGRTPIR